MDCMEQVYNVKDRLIRISFLKKILSELGLWNKQIEKRLEEFKKTGL